MIRKPFPPAMPGRRGAAAGGNLPGITGNYQNLQGYDLAALAAALQACGINCTPGAAGFAKAGSAGSVMGDVSQVPQHLAGIASAIANIQSQQPQRCRRTMMGLAKVTVPALSTGITSSTSPVQYPFRGLRLIVPTDISPSGDLANLQVGTERQIVQANAVAPGVTPFIPLRAFDQTGQDTGFIDMDWCPPTGSTNVDVTVTNKFAAPYIFEGALEGLQLV
jgi:hypothetical protein